MLTKDLLEAETIKYIQMMGASFAPGRADIASQVAKDEDIDKVRLGIAKVVASRELSRGTVDPRLFNKRAPKRVPIEEWPGGSAHKVGDIEDKNGHTVEEGGAGTLEEYQVNVNTHDDCQRGVQKKGHAKREEDNDELTKGGEVRQFPLRKDSESRIMKVGGGELKIADKSSREGHTQQSNDEMNDRKS